MIEDERHIESCPYREPLQPASHDHGIHHRNDWRCRGQQDSWQAAPYLGWRAQTDLAHGLADLSVRHVGHVIPYIRWCSLVWIPRSAGHPARGLMTSRAPP
jgi:hypothetical protein